MKLCILIHVLMILTVILGHSGIRNLETLVSMFSQTLVLICMKFSMLPQSVGLLKLMLNLFCTRYIQETGLCWPDYIKYTFNIITCQDTHERICFKLCMMLDTTKLYSLIPVWMAFMFTQGHTVMRHLQLVHSFCCKVAWSYLDVHDDWLHKGDGCERVL